MEPNTIHTGDAFDVLPTLATNSVHAVVTDPPYGLAFMGRSWDDFEPKEYQEWCEEWAAEVKRVLKPGGHLLAFSGNRTHHRLFSGVEDAGFEIRDTITWHYGSGFPKALDVSKAIDKAADAEREFTDGGSTDCEYLNRGVKCEGHGTETSQAGVTYHTPDSEPATDAAERWDGFKTALKPATEYVVVARKPLSEGTVAENVQTHGTGALNIDGTRIGTSGGHEHTGEEDNSTTVNAYGDGLNGTTSPPADKGRYPSNVAFDESSTTDDVPTRYFYTSKATKAERTLDGRIDNAHPTVKPADLMEWLVTLVTAEDQIVLDPFAGTGTTCRAAKDLSRRFVGIERQDKWADVARVRCGLSPEDATHVRSDDAQQGFEAYTDD